MRTLLLSLVATTLLLAGPRSAPAADTAPTAAQGLLAEIAAAKAARENAKLMEALGRVGAVWTDASPDERKALANATGDELKSKVEGVQTAALDALVATKDGEAAWKAGLKSELPDAKADAATPFSLKVLVALKTLRPEAAVTPLLALLDKCKDPKASSGALQALGAYERSKQRVTILEQTLDVLKLHMPPTGIPKGGKRPPISPHWTEMAPHIVPMLNALTGQNVADFKTWLEMWDTGKKKPASLFKNSL